MTALTTSQTGYGAYHLVVSAGLLGMILKDGPSEWTLRDWGSWKSFWLPEVVRTSEDASRSRRITKKD